MATRLGRFEMPKQVVKDEEVSTSTYGKFYAEPLRWLWPHDGQFAAQSITFILGGCGRFVRAN